MPITITDKVGILCINRPEDVAKIQDALNRVPPTQGQAVPPLVPNGFCDKKTTDAIQKFQLKQFGWSGADGKIFPGGQTITRLNELLPDTPGPAIPPKQTGVRWRLEFNTGNRNFLSKLEPWFLLFTDLDDGRSWRFWLSKFQVSSEQDRAFGTPFEFTTDPLSPLDFENAIFVYRYFLDYKGLPPLPDIAGNLPFFQQTERGGTAEFRLTNGYKFWLMNMPPQIVEADLQANQPGLYSETVAGRLKNTSK
ncbi:MAG: hypothetical protein U0R19_00565 [Bryobacteraceae bacterium]